jgi:putative membrane protein
MIRNAILAAAALACLAATPALAKDDKSFLTDVVMGNNAEIAIGKLAEAQGGSEAVRSYGKVLVDDHSKSQTEVAPMAKAAGVTMMDGMMPADEAEYNKLKALKGKAFDAELASSMAKAHKMMIAEFTEQTKSGSPETVKLAAATLPTLEKHLKLATALENI